MSPNERRDEWCGPERRRRGDSFHDDHDAVIEFGVKIGNLQRAIEQIAENHEKYKEKNEADKAWIMRFGYIGYGIAIAVTFYFKYIRT